MTYEEAISKAAKLLRLSKSSNPNEAALAASKAQEIIERFKLDAGMLEYDGDKKPDEPIKDFGFDPLDSAGGSWRWRLTHALAQQNQCKGYVISKGRPCLIGRPSDVQTVRYLYAWLVSEIEQLTRKECAGCGRNYANNFRLGVVETVTERLETSRKETHAAMKAEAAQVEAVSNGMALMRLNHAIARLEKKAAEVEDWQKKNRPLRTSSRLGRGGEFNPDARQAGRIAGEFISIRPTKGHIA